MNLASILICLFTDFSEAYHLHSNVHHSPELPSFLWKKNWLTREACSFLSLASLSSSGYFHKYKFSPPNDWCMFVWEMLSFTTLGHCFIWLQPFVMRHRHKQIHKQTHTHTRTCTHTQDRHATERLPVGTAFTMLWINLFYTLYLPWYWSVRDRLFNMHTPAYKPTMGTCGLAFARLWIWREIKFELCHNLLQRGNISQRRANLTWRKNGYSSTCHDWRYIGNPSVSCMPLTLHLKNPTNNSFICLFIHLSYNHLWGTILSKVLGKQMWVRQSLI